jgi:hypothetical protein
MKTDNYLALDFEDVSDLTKLFPQSRREFLKRVGGGIVIFIAFADFLEAAADCLRTSMPSCGSAKMAV